MVLTTATQTLTNKSIATTQLTGRVPAANAPLGSVIQVVQTVKTDTFSTTGTSFVEIPGYSVTLTPSSTSSRVMIDVSLHIGENQDAFPLFRMYRNGVELPIAPVISPGQTGMFGKCTTQNSSRDQYLLEPVNFKYIDSPSTTESVTYTIRGRPMGISSGRTIFVNRMQTIGDGNQFTTISTLTATEIAA
jgi:hypothetical protein